MKTQVEISNHSDVGKVRTVNEDYFAFYTGKFGNVLIVSDGMGGYKGGFVASHLAVEAVKNHFATLDNNIVPREELRKALQNANNDIKTKALEDIELKNMGATAVVLLRIREEVFIAHIGDSRIYMVRGDKIHQLTKDHSLVQQMVDGGLITAEAARNHPNRNIITQVLGSGSNNTPFIEKESISIFRGDYFVLCSDGLTGYLEDEEIKTIVLSHPGQEACRLMVDIANKRGGKDNITVQILEVKKGKRIPVNLNSPMS